MRMGWCLESHDLAASKLAAGRDKDWTFVEVMLRDRIVDAATLHEPIAAWPVADDRKEALRWIGARAPQAASSGGVGQG